MRKLPFSFIKTSIESIGYTLLSKEDSFKNTTSTLVVKCNESHIFKTHWNRFQQGSRCPVCRYINQGHNQKGENNSQWKGGVRKSQLPLYTTYVDRLSIYHNVYRVKKDTLILLGVECYLCKKIYVPKNKAVQARLASLEGKRLGESNFYCSEECKNKCTVYKQRKYPKNDKPYIDNRWSHSTWAKMVKKRDNYVCQICGKSKVPLVAHHITPVSVCDMFSLDICNGITLCNVCHKNAHATSGCKFKDLKNLRSI